MNDLEFLANLATRAGKLLLQMWPKTPGAANLQIQQKPDGSIVTNADFTANELITRELAIGFPNHQIVSEEGPHQFSTDYQVGKFIVIDPLDGTKNFAHGTPNFAVLIAEVQNGKVTKGIQYWPVEDLLITAEIGKGCYFNGIKKTLFVDNSPSFDRMIFVPTSKEKIIFPKLASHFNNHDAENSIYKLPRILLSNNQSGSFFEFYQEKIWDVLPFIVILEEMGTPVTAEDGGPVRFRNDQFVSQALIIGSPPQRKQILDLIAGSQ